MTMTTNLEPFFVRYIVGWLVFCLVAVVLAARSVRLRPRDIVAFLGVPWKVALFGPAIVFVTFAGHFTDDETWDVVSGGGMSILTVLTSWWAVGTAVRVVRRQRPWPELVVAIAVTLFASSWFYDGYLLLRDGAYSARWLGNLMLSPTIYLAAGVVSNLELREGGTIGFAFSRASWPAPPPRRSASLALALASLPFVIIAGYFLVGFVGWHW